MARSERGCPILTDIGCGDLAVRVETTASVCMDNCPMPFCVLDYETKKGNNRNDVRVAVLWYSGKSIQEIAHIIGWRLETIKETLNKWHEREKELAGVA